MPRILWNPKARYRIHKHRPPVPFLNHSNIVHASPLQILKIHCNITLLPKPRSSKWPPSIRSLHENPVCTSPVSHMFHMPRPPHHSRFDQPNNIRLQIRRHRTKWVAQEAWRPGFVHTCNCPIRVINPSIHVLACSRASRYGQTIWRSQSHWLTERRKCTVSNCGGSSHSTANACGWGYFIRTAHHLQQMRSL